MKHNALKKDYKSLINWYVSYEPFSLKIHMSPILHIWCQQFLCT